MSATPRRLRLVASLLLLASGPLRAAELPPKIQAILFRKILAYDRSLPSDAKKMLVVYADEPSADVERMAQALRDVELAPTVVKASALSASLEGTAGVYLFPHAATAATKELCERTHHLTLGAGAELAEKGVVAVALAVKDGKPEILVNVREAKAEAQEFSADLLNLAVIIR